ncbi:MAG TPA: hypothetical protein VG842_09675 [Sediminibacterium sp.]|nr:hypothetical protein [Sediminibacterium sp.]
MIRTTAPYVTILAKKDVERGFLFTGGHYQMLEGAIHNIAAAFLPLGMGGRLRFDAAFLIAGNFLPATGA